MRNLGRSIRKRIRAAFNPNTVAVNGITLVADKKRVPRKVRDLMYRDGYEDTERNILLQVLKPGTKVVEIGTGMGFIALLASKICGPHNVVTFEANPKVESLIRDNFALNNMSPTLHMRAVTKDGRDLSFHAADSIIASSAFDRGVPGERVLVKSEPFDAVLNALNPDVLIMDVEGAEYELLRTEDLKSITDIIVELHPHIIGQERVDEIKHSLSRTGFREASSDRKTYHFRRERHVAF
ncbi:FkbM family methyltransferase [Neorhizobium sp. R1-B]|jgi:FkbM family methyltransferase|uniref:FkbM family methyltransferase n=1 Tax=Neorhizobium sp. R1-B TaxID=2485162 RepID=UPI001064FF74|nr:FkbM family methyltransferase [Neorhizobium sp. R1-B]TDX88135.1 FkbM family methyltransferase [Neorhizobium sp. R1-B]